ncbi:MAG: folate-binding protein, partial [Pseudomonadota bacterium]
MSSPFAYLPHRAVLSLSGPDTITLLERLVTNATNAWAQGETRYGALLTPQGKVLADFLAIRTPEGVILDVAEAHVDDLAKRLKMFRLRSQVEIERLESVFVVAGLEAAPEGVRPISGAQHVYLDGRYPGGRLRGLATKESWAAWYGYHPAEWSRPVNEYHMDRIEHGIAEQGIDFGSAEVFPADINMDILGGVALNKGCFVGQEVVSRMHRRGSIRRRTLVVS